MEIGKPVFEILEHCEHTLKYFQLSLAFIHCQFFVRNVESVEIIH